MKNILFMNGLFYVLIMSITYLIESDGMVRFSIYNVAFIGLGINVMISFCCDNKRKSS